MHVLADFFIGDLGVDLRGADAGVAQDAEGASHEVKVTNIFPSGTGGWVELDKSQIILGDRIFFDGQFDSNNVYVEGNAQEMEGFLIPQNPGW